MKPIHPPIAMDGWNVIAHPRRNAVKEDNNGVSEIIGVVMLLAMVVSILAIVMVALKPYVDDFDDNKNWSSARVLSEQVQARIDVVGSAPNGTGVAFTLPLVTSTIHSLNLVETWTIQSDLFGLDRVDVKLVNATAFEISSDNETISSIGIYSDGILRTYNVTNIGATHTFDTGQIFGRELIIDVENADGIVIHRLVRLQLSGLQMNTGLNIGVHNTAMINHGMMSRMPNNAWNIEKFPPLHVEETFSGQRRVTLMLSDIQTTSSLPTGKSSTLQIISRGPLTLFDGEARNLRFSVDNQLHSNINPQFTELWTGDHLIHQATGDTSTYFGFAPWGKSSGINGIGLFPNDEVVLLEIGIQRVEVS
jgi:FlaG/FlaF family flagellin (archaellin)